MASKNETGKKPGHNAAKKGSGEVGFQPTAPSQPAVPTAAPAQTQSKTKEIPDYRLIYSPYGRASEQYEKQLALNLANALGDLRTWLLARENHSAKFREITEDFRETVVMYDQDFRAIITLGLTTGGLDYTVEGDGLIWRDDKTSGSRHSVEEETRILAAASRRESENRNRYSSYGHP